LIGKEGNLNQTSNANSKSLSSVACSDHFFYMISPASKGQGTPCGILSHSSLLPKKEAIFTRENINGTFRLFCQHKLDMLEIH